MSSLLKTKYQYNQKKGTAQFEGGDGNAYSPGDPIPVFNITSYNDSDNIIRLSATQIKLLANRKYKLRNTIDFYQVSGDQVPTQFYSVTDAAYVGSISYMLPTTNPVGVASNLQAELTIAPTVDTTLELRNVLSAGITMTQFYVSTCTIEELEAYQSTEVGNEYVQGYTQLGTNAPKIKMKKITGTTDSSQGGQTTIAHGLDASKIISVTSQVYYNSNTDFVLPSHTWSAGYEYNLSVDTTNIYVNNSGANSSNILSKPVTILITYEE